MALDTSNNYHVEYPDVYRHWSASCEKYAGGDGLVTMLRGGWHIEGDSVTAEEFWLAGTRPVTVYHMKMVRGDESMSVPVITNPYVRRVIRMHSLKVVPLESSGKRQRA